MKRKAAPARARRRSSRVLLALLDEARPRTDRSFVRRVVRAVLQFSDRLEMPVSLLITDDAGIAALHATHLGDPSPTDVMSFSIDDTAEVVVSAETARRVARQRGHRAEAELALYIVHGILHAVGFDDGQPRARRRMRAAEREVLQRLRLTVAEVDA